ncbi:MAG: biopolymer transporter ExbD [bacterium]|nr:biopolymer transporter ExbD [bacterium]
MQFTTGRPRRVSLDMTPLIDVVLMLVIFFMLTTTFVLAPGIKVDLPKGLSVQQTRDTDKVVIIMKNGAVYYQDERVDLATLQAALQQAQQKQPGLRVVIKADKNALHGRVVEVMDMAKSMGIARLAIATAPKQISQP